MLNNTNWDKSKVKHDVHSLFSLIDWLETKDSNESYTYYSPHRCPLARYYRSKGYWFVRMWATSFGHGFFNSTRLPDGFNFIVVQGPHTYGAALKRARKLADERWEVGRGVYTASLEQG